MRNHFFVCYSLIHLCVCAHAYMRTCVHIHAHIHTHTHTHAHQYVAVCVCRQRPTPGISLRHSPAFLLRCSLTEPGAYRHGCASSPAGSQGPPLSTSQASVTGICVTSNSPLLCGCRDSLLLPASHVPAECPNSDPQAYRTRPLLTQPSPASRPRECSPVTVMLLAVLCCWSGRV